MTSDPPIADPSPDDRRLARRVERWFARAARPLPWREVDPSTGSRDPYRSLVSEFMLQQTQVSRVVERFEPFLRRFPTPRALARAPESQVLAAWAGLGYYRRARLLHAAARAMVRDHAGHVPRFSGALRELPGVGRYTAGAVASIVFGQPEPIVDGNVARVLLRISARDTHAADPAALAWAWVRAGELVRAAGDPGAFNEGLMELGATVCTPASPRCGACPLAGVCLARRRGVQSSIPRPKPRPARRRITLDCAVVLDGRGRLLVERGAPEGLWAGLWRPPTLEGPGRPARDAARALSDAIRLPRLALRRAGTIERTLSHRDVTLRLWVGSIPGTSRAGPGRTWLAGGALHELSAAHREAVAKALGSPAGHETKTGRGEAPARADRQVGQRSPTGSRPRPPR